MTLPVAFPLSMSQIATELGLALPLSINHAWVLKLAGVSALPLSFNQLLGKTGRFDGNAFASSFGVGGANVQLGSSPFFNTALVNMTFDPTNVQTVLNVNSASNWTGNIKVTNNTTGISLVIPYQSGNTWKINSAPVNLARPNQTDNFTILPST